MKTLNLKKTTKALEVLERIKQCIDPNAFIAGGLPASLYLGLDWHTTDTDVFFSSPNFEVDGLGDSAFHQLKAVFPDINSVNKEVYWYNKRFCRVGGLSGVDFIQIKNAPATGVTNYVFAKFDINLCKITMTGSLSEYRSEVCLEPTQEFLDGIKTRTLIYNTNLSDHRYESEAQAKVTMSRLAKYEARFTGYSVKQTK